LQPQVMFNDIKTLALEADSLIRYPREAFDTGWASTSEVVMLP